MIIHQTIQMEIPDSSFNKLNQEEIQDFLSIQEKAVIGTATQLYGVKLNRDYGKKGVKSAIHVHQSTSAYACEFCVERLANNEEN